MLVRMRHYPMFRPSWRGVLDFERDLGSVLDSLSARAFAPGVSRAPLMDLTAGESESILSVELPGVEKDDLKISLEDGLLTISGERKPQGIPDNARWLRSESISGKFVRTLELPHPVDPKGISAELRNGILRVVLPRAEEARPHEIAIR